MRISKSWLYGGLILAAGFGMMRLASAPRLKRGMRVLVVGDSLAVGMGPHFQSLGKESGIDVKVQASVGTRIDQWAGSTKLQQALESFRPNMVIVSLGTNDEYLTGSDAVAKQQAALERLIAKFQSAGVEHIVWVGPPTLPKQSNGITAMIQEAAGGLSPRFHYFHSERLEIPRGPDKIHPTARGYAGWAGAVWHWLS